jgi:hypothetical protein
METKEIKNHLSEGEFSQLVQLAQHAIAPNTGLRGQGPIALTLRERGFGVRAISRFLSTNGLPVSPASVSKFLNKQNTPSNTP